MDWIRIIEEFGPVFGLIFFLLWRDQKRHDDLTRQIREKDEFIENTLVHLIERVNDALNRK